MEKTFYTRHAELTLREALEDFPVVLIQGARQCGKTTLARMVGKSAGYAYLNFDDQDVFQVAENDPARFVDELPKRAVLDEVQKVPRLFSAIKMSVDRNRVAGRFILTGSVSVLHVRQITDSLAGRMAIVNLHPFSQCEIEKAAPTFLDKLFAGDFEIARKKVPLSQTIDRMIKGGYPDAFKLSSERKKMSWYGHYIEALIHHDVPEIARIRSLDVLSKLLSLSAAQTAQLFNTNQLSKSFQLSRKTIHDYLMILEMMFMIKRLPAWHSQHTKRLIKTPKIHLIDTGVACALTGFNRAALSDDKDRFGRLLETFVFQELQRQESGHPLRHTFSHYRDKDGTEADLVIERGAESLAGVEVKASATIGKTDFTGLRRLKKAAGKRFKCGVVVHTGETSLPFGDKLYAVPLRLLWEKA